MQPGASVLNCAALPSPYNVAETVAYVQAKGTVPALLLRVCYMQKSDNREGRPYRVYAHVHTHSCRFLPGPGVTPLWLSFSISERAAVPQQTHTELLPAVANRPPPTYSLHCIVQQFSNKALTQPFLDRQPLLY